MTDTPPLREENKDANGPVLQWHLLGGNNKHRIGANCGLCTYEEPDGLGGKHSRSVLFDAGMLFGDQKYPEDPALTECDVVIPDLARFLEKPDDPKHKPERVLDAIFLTHNHADHLGAIPFLLLMGYKLPKIYATPYTAKKLEQELSNAGLDPMEWPVISTIAPGAPVQEGPLSVSAFWVSHSTPQSAGFFIDSPAGTILQPGDFKLDQTVVCGPAFSAEQFRRVVSKPVDLLLLDSTGADRDITPTTEHDVRETLHGLMDQNPDKRFVIAVMSGFEENLASVAKVAAEKGKTFWISGWSHEQGLRALKETGRTLSDAIGMPLDLRTLQSGKAARDLAESKPGNNVVVVTGASGQPSSNLPRAAEGNYSALQLDPKNDIILICAPTIPGQEYLRERMVNSLRNKGFEVITRKEAEIWSQAHARLPEMLELARLADAKTVLPVHGGENLRKSCATAIEKMGQKTLSADNGDVVRVTKNGCHSVNPASKGKPKLTGFKTLQGTSWTDKYYIKVDAPARGNKKTSPAANNNRKKRPQIFNIK